MSRPAAWFLAGVTALVLTGCSEGSDAFNTNEPDDQANPAGQQVIRTPAVVPPDLPYSDPPLVEPLPGPTGGVPGDVPTQAGEASPGAGSFSETNQE